MWQALFDELKDQNFSIITVAMDADAEAARPFIEAAAPDYISLIDRDHRVAGLYNMVNVPQAVWIDESRQIVRPPEVAGTYDPSAPGIRSPVRFQPKSKHDGTKLGSCIRMQSVTG